MRKRMMLLSVFGIILTSILFICCGDSNNNGDDDCKITFVHGRISTGELHTCALTSKNGLMCWGDNIYGQLGNGTTVDSHLPVNVTGLSSGVVAVSVGRYHTCALTSSGDVMCWGDNLGGQLGDGTTIQRNTPVNVVGLLSGIVAVSAGYYHTCALTSSRSLMCWGTPVQNKILFGQHIEG